MSLYFVPTESSPSLLSVPDVLQVLHESLHVHKLLVEGGAHILQTFLALSLFDKLIVTVVPTFAGGPSVFTSFQPQHVSKATLPTF